MDFPITNLNLRNFRDSIARTMSCYNMRLLKRNFQVKFKENKSMLFNAYIRLQDFLTFLVENVITLPDSILGASNRH